MQLFAEKRFTSHSKWDDPWYRRMKPIEKCFWEYLCTRCDNSGVWKVDFDLATFHLGQEVDKTVLTSINKGKDRVLILNGGNYWLVKDFITYQYVELSEKSPVHKSIINLVNKHTLSIGYPKDTYTLKDKDKDKEKETELVKEAVTTENLIAWED